MMPLMMKYFGKVITQVISISEIFVCLKKLEAKVAETIKQNLCKLKEKDNLLN